MNVIGDGRNRELQMLTAGLMQSSAQGGMRAASANPGMQSQGQVGGTQMARLAALAQMGTPQLPSKLCRPLYCAGSWGALQR